MAGLSESGLVTIFFRRSISGRMMRYTFIEMPAFTSRLPHYLNDDEYSRFQWRLMADPSSGAVIPGCGGLRKVRVGIHKDHRGKRGGLRVVYPSIPEVGVIFFLKIYAKDEKDDPDAREKSILRTFAEQLKKQAIGARPDPARRKP